MYFLEREEIWIKWSKKKKRRDDNVKILIPSFLVSQKASMIQSTNVFVGRQLYSFNDMLLNFSGPSKLQNYFIP